MTSAIIKGAQQGFYTLCCVWASFLWRSAFFIPKLAWILNRICSILSNSMIKPSKTSQIALYLLHMLPNILFYITSTFVKVFPYVRYYLCLHYVNKLRKLCRVLFDTLVSTPCDM